MAIPIPDLRVDDDGVFATLSFQRSPYTCWIPWDAVFAVVSDDGKGMMWPENLPEEIATDVDREFAKMGAAELEEVLAAADYDADPLHAPSEVRSSITSRPLRLIDSAPPPPPSHAPASQSLSSHSLPTRNGVKPGSQAPSAATPSAATPSAATRRASTPKRSSTSSRPSSAPHLRLIK